MLTLAASSALAQMPNPDGAPISLENAKKAAATAVAEAAMQPMRLDLEHVK